MSVTTSMSLVLPTVSATLGPLWATELNTALTLVDSHDHSTGKGVKITPSGLNINTDLSLQSNDLTLVRTVALNSQAATLSASDVRAVYSVLGDLYWNNGSGTAVQITSGASVQSSSSTISRAFERLAVNANKTILAGDTYSYLDTNTGSSVTYTLPAANSVSAGRFYEFKDSTGQAATNNITINRAGADTIDGAASVVVNLNYGSTRLTSDGTSKWLLGTLPEAQLLKSLTSVKNVTNFGNTPWTPTGSFVLNTTYTGKYRRVGDVGEFIVNLAFSGAPTSATALTINLPAGHTIDTSKTLGVSLAQKYGYGLWVDGSVVGILDVHNTTTTAVAVMTPSTGTSSNLMINPVTNVSPTTFGSGDSIRIFFSVPIVEYA